VIRSDHQSQLTEWDADIPQGATSEVEATMTMVGDGDPIAGTDRHQGIVAEIVDDRATVLVGDAQETWDFPVEMLPARIEVGTYLVITMVAGRPTTATLHHEREAEARSGLDTRLARLARYEQLTGHRVRIE